MEGGSNSKMKEKKDRQKDQNPKIEPFVPKKGHDPRELKSWAKRTGFVSTTFSGDTERANSLSRRDFTNGRDPNVRNDNAGFDLERGVVNKTETVSPKIELDPILGRARNRGVEIEPVLGEGLGNGTRRGENLGRRIEMEPILRAHNEDRKDGLNENGNGNNSANGAVNGNGHIETRKDDVNVDEEVGYPDGEDPSYGGWHKSPPIKCGLRENPGLVPLMYYGLQHYLSLAGSLIFIPLIIVPTMGGSDKDTANVVSTMLLVSGLTTILHSYFGTRLPLVQGSSFVYLAPALVIMNSEEYRNLADHKFRYIMRELQGAIIVGSIFQSFLGYSGLMSLLLRFINPVVVAPTVAAVGLAFFSYGFPQAGSCVEISLPQILLLLIFTLYLRGISIFGHRVFRIYAVLVSVIIIWAYAFFLTTGGAYNFKGCSADIPSSNILIDACRKHADTMRHCRTDVSNAMRTAAWVRIPYPFQWGIPTFRLRTSIIMVIVSLVASVDSIGSYHSAAIRINLKPPTPGIVSRGIGLEGFCSVLAGLWGTGTGSTTLTENVHTINATKVANRRAVQLGAAFLILFSFVGKIGAILASIPQALAAAVLCFIWALIVALGLSTLQYTQNASSRNIIIVGVSLFFGLSIPAYFQQYAPETGLILPGYLIPYAAASNGPVHTGNAQFNFAMNALLSLNMVVTLLVAFILDNTVPGSRQERGVYVWSKAEDIMTDPSSLLDYSLPSRVARCFHWAKCVGT
ncbi:nucleobase-ascorbate transporter 11 [Nicotiana tabacum]|uniref:Nucleobase-ascorbate transporter 11 n=1 Tax=Nicotiana tabacum TaxID=4097 RepID=A0A1S3X1U3_TOBAC|nr:nucleobase-ascorbate transporter 11 [Nicotiana tomentosiformis]XP_016433663.1 PREDICTED: nucleobase-ascorbate transporter 11-like [Nicotiana tabacum]